MKKHKKLLFKITAAITACALLPAAGLLYENTVAEGRTEGLRAPVETTLEKSTLGNPFLGFDAQGNRAYGGDPSILVDGDTVYAYVGHDVSEVECTVLQNICATPARI